MRTDIGLAVVLTLVALLTLPVVDQLSDADRPIDALGVGLIIVACMSTAARRRWPVLVLIAATLALTTYLAIGYPYGPVVFGLAIAVYSVARQLPLVPASLWCSAALAVLILHLLTNEAALAGLAGLVPAVAWVSIPFTLGVSRQLVVDASARERAESEARLVDDERLRLAHEVHDVVGHGLAAIQMQADIALHMKDRRPEQAVRALEAISRASSDALAELRATLSSVAPVDSDAAGARMPVPGLARLEDLRSRVEAAGVDVPVTVHGDPRPLPAAVDVAAYRVVQEALTNVVKHSAHPQAEVCIEYQPHEVTVVIANQDIAAHHPRTASGSVGCDAGSRISAAPSPPALRALAPARASRSARRSRPR